MKMNPQMKLLYHIFEKIEFLKVPIKNVKNFVQNMQKFLNLKVFKNSIFSTFKSNFLKNVIKRFHLDLFEAKNL